MSLRRDLIKHIKSVALDHKNEHVFVVNSEMFSIEDAQHAMQMLANSNVKASILMVKGDVRQAVSITKVVDGEPQEITDNTEVK